jgi:dTMP kinase
MMEWAERLRGRFLVFDGPDGSGKSTQIDRFSAWCAQHAVPLEIVREPGGTPIGEAIRLVLLDPRHAEMTIRTEMLLYMASRAQLVRERIRPALEAGSMVLADRFISSTLAYQGTAGGLEAEEILEVGRVATDGVEPDLIVIFDVDATTGLARISGGKDRMEQKSRAFHERVRDGYLAQASRDPDRYLVIDASQAADTVFEALIRGLDAHVPVVSSRGR